jgi:hypothetical protein
MRTGGTFSPFSQCWARSKFILCTAILAMTKYALNTQSSNVPALISGMPSVSMASASSRPTLLVSYGRGFLD